MQRTTARELKRRIRLFSESLIYDFDCDDIEGMKSCARFLEQNVRELYKIKKEGLNAISK